MIFRSELARLVLSGRKTQTRRRVKGNESCRYVPGRDYAVQEKRGGKAIGRIKVTHVRRERLRDLTVQDAVAEGFVGETLWTGERIGPVEQFFLYWSRLHNETPVDEEQQVHAIFFELDAG